MATVAELQADIARVKAKQGDPATEAWFKKTYGTNIAGYIAGQEARLRQLQQTPSTQKITQDIQKAIAATTPTTTPKTPTMTPITPKTTTPTTAPKTTTTQPGLGQLTQPLPQYHFPYEQAIRDITAQIPKYTPRPESELLAQARQYARLQVDPQIQELQRGLEQIRQATEAQRRQIEAGHTGFQESIGRMLKEREAQALESAIARGGGRSGAVEWLTKQQQAPVLEQATRVEAETAAALRSLAESLGLTEQQVAKQIQQLEARRGELEAQQLASLRQLEHANATGNWQLAQQAMAQLAQLATQARQFEQEYALSMLPYYQLTEAERQKLPLDYAQAIGEIPAALPGAAPATTATAVPLRSYAGDLGAGIDYDPATDQVIINGRRYTPQMLEAAGGYREGGHWYLPQSWVDQQLGRR